MEKMLYIEGAMPSYPDGQYSSGNVLEHAEQNNSIDFNGIRYTLSDEDINYNESELT